MNEVSLKPVIDELETLFSKFNKAFFEGKLEKPVITVSPDHTRGAYGWCTAWKAWQDGTKEGGYNIKVLLQPFDRQKMINSGLKVATFIVGLTLLCVAITTLPIYADQLGWAIPEEYTEIFADLVIVGAVLMVSCKYIAEAFTKFRAILQVKGDTENE